MKGHVPASLPRTCDNSERCWPSSVRKRADACRTSAHTNIILQIRRTLGHTVTHPHPFQSWKTLISQANLHCGGRPIQQPPRSCGDGSNIPSFTASAVCLPSVDMPALETDLRNVRQEACAACEDDEFAILQCSSTRIWLGQLWNKF